MKFKTSDLIGRIDNLLRDLEGKAITAAEEYDEKLEGSRDAWLEDHAAGFQEFAFNINRQLNSGKPVTTDDIPKGIKSRWNELKVYSPPSMSLKSENRQYDELMKLRTALAASTEEAVSPTAIKQLGFQDVTFLFTPEAAA